MTIAVQKFHTSVIHIKLKWFDRIRASVDLAVSVY